MDFIERLAENNHMLTATEKRISEYILANQQLTVRANIAELGTLCGASKSAVLRYAQKLGYSGFSEFRYDFSRYVHAGLIHKRPDSNKISLISGYYESAIKKMGEELEESTLQELVQVLIKAKKVKIFGLNRNGFSAQQLRHHLHTIDFDAEAVYDSVLVQNIAGAGSSEDVHIFMSANGATSIVRDAIGISYHRGVTTILITVTPNSVMKKYATHEIVLPSTRSTTTDFFLDQQALVFIFIELLIVYLGAALAKHSSKQ